MGCDIHTLVQVKYNEEWVTVALNVANDRSYLTFGALAGVRDKTVTPIAEPRGVPDDLNPYYKHFVLGDHSFSWLTLKEIQEYACHIDEYIDEVPENEQLLINLGNVVKGIVDVLPWHHNFDFEDVRFVFGFDS